MKFDFLTIIAVLVLTFLFGLQTADAQSKIPAKETALIAFLVKDSKPSAEMIKDLPFLAVIIGKTQYIVESKSGKVIGQSRTADGSGGFYGAYAEVSVLLLDTKKGESGAGAGQLLKTTGGRWKTIAVNETDYQCADVKTVPKAVLKALKVECF